MQDPFIPHSCNIFRIPLLQAISYAFCISKNQQTGIGEVGTRSE